MIRRLFSALKDRILAKFSRRPRETPTPSPQFFAPSSSENLVTPSGCDHPPSKVQISNRSRSIREELRQGLRKKVSVPITTENYLAMERLRQQIGMTQCDYVDLALSMLNSFIVGGRIVAGKLTGGLPSEIPIRAQVTHYVVRLRRKPKKVEKVDRSLPPCERCGRPAKFYDVSRGFWLCERCWGGKK